MSEKYAVSKKLKRARQLANLSQDDLAKSLGVSNKTISAYESERAIPPLHTLKKIAEITNQPVNFFLKRKSLKVI